MSDEEFAYRTDRPVEELRKELEDLAAGWTVRPTDTHSPLSLYCHLHHCLC